MTLRDHPAQPTGKQPLRRSIGRTIVALAHTLRPHLALLLILAATCGASIYYERHLPLLEGAEEAGFIGSALDSLDLYDDPAYAELADQFGDHEAAERSPVYRALSREAVRLALRIEKDTVPIRTNPYLRQYDLTSSANQNTLLYPLAEGGVARAVRWLRFLSLLAILGATVCAYVMTNWLTGHRAAASIVAATCGLLPNSLIMASTANADALTALVAALLLALSIRLWQRPPTPGRAMIWGALPALAILVSPALRAISLVPLLVLILGVREAPEQPASHKAWTGVGYAAILFVALRTGANLLSESSGPLVLSVAQAVAGAHAQSVSTIVQRFAQAFWGLLDWRSVTLDRVIYTALNALALISAGGLGLALVRRTWQRQPLAGRRGWWIVLVFVGLSSARFVWMLLRNNGLLVEGQAALLVPGAVLLALGWAEWLPHRAHGVACAVLSALLLSASLSLPQADQRSTPPAPLDLSYLEDENITPVGIAFGDELYLVGYSTDTDTVARGNRLTLRLIWLVRKQPQEDYTVSVAVTGRQQMQVGIVDTMPGGGQSPTSQWVPGQIVQDEITVPISPRANTPSKGEIRVSVYRKAKEMSLKAHAPDGSPLGSSPRIGVIRLVSPNVVQYAPRTEMQVDFGGTIRLFGFGAVPAQPVLGQNWTIDLYWQALAPVDRDYTVFAHLVNAYGRILAQTDEQPLQGDYPTTMWLAGEQIHDLHAIAVPEQLVGEPYYLLIGLYDPTTGERLTYTTADGTVNDHVTFGPLAPSEPWLP